MHLLIKKQVEGGFISKHIVPATEVGIHINIDPIHPPMVNARLPALRSFKDVCEKCGAVFAFRVERGHVTFTGDVRQPFRDFK
jgi:hypothetical protein